MTIRTHSLIALCLCLIAAGVARAQSVPLTFTQQGRLTNSDGTPTAGPVMMTFSVYDSTTTTTPLWTESQMVALDGGAFSVQLGSVTPFKAGLWNGATLYLGLKVANDQEMTPREQIATVPYALLANNALHAATADNATTAAQLSGFDPSQYQRILAPADCGGGRYIQAISAGGAVTCATLPPPPVGNRFGGIYGGTSAGQISCPSDSSGLSCNRSNPFTGGCFCPSGFSSVTFGGAYNSANNSTSCFYECIQ
jgi:hypothetical protein